jgi:hypothetical protein
MQRQVRLYLRIHDHPVSGNKGETTTPTAALVFALFASFGRVQLQFGYRMIQQVYGLQPHHLLICDTLGLDYA